MIKAVIFDLDDTLISEKEYIRSGFRQVSKKIADEYSLNDSDVYELMYDTFNEDSKNVFNRVLDKLNIEYEMSYIKELINFYREHVPDIKLYDDAKYIIEVLYDKGIKLGMITDGYKVTQRNKLEVLGISNYFDCIVVTDELGREFWKPHSKPYEIVKEKLGFEYENMVYVGDNVSKDFVMANKLGMETVFINREDGVYQNINKSEDYMAKHTINILNQLEDIVTENSKM